MMITRRKKGKHSCDTENILKVLSIEGVKMLMVRASLRSDSSAEEAMPEAADRASRSSKRRTGSGQSSSQQPAHSPLPATLHYYTTALSAVSHSS